jgi:hypothetical protein
LLLSGDNATESRRAKNLLAKSGMYKLSSFGPP